MAANNGESWVSTVERYEAAVSTVWVSTVERYEAAVSTVWVSTGLLENEMGPRESKWPPAAHRLIFSQNQTKLEPKVWTEKKGVHERRKDGDSGELNKNDWVENGVLHRHENRVLNEYQNGVLHGG